MGSFRHGLVGYGASFSECNGRDNALRGVNETEFISYKV